MLRDTRSLHAFPELKSRSGFPVVTHRHEQRQRLVVAKDPSVVEPVQLVPLDLERVVANRLARLFEIDDLGERDLFEAGEDGAEDVERV